MPELPEVETVCRGLAQHALGKVIRAVILHRQSLRFPIPPDFAARVDGRRITDVQRRSKYILMHLNDGGRILLHLGMSGRLFFIDRIDHPPEKHDHVQFFLDNDTCLVFNDARRFGVLDYLPPEMATHRLLDRIGLDPFSEWLTWQWLYEAFRKRRVSMKNILMDQAVIAGLGNIYVAESLYLAHVWPERSSDTLTKAEAKKLVSAIRDVLNASIDAGGSSLRDYVQTSGEMGFFQDKFKVYGREGQPCFACGTPITRLVQAGRSTFACRVCQK